VVGVERGRVPRCDEISRCRTVRLECGWLKAAWRGIGAPVRCLDSACRWGSLLETVGVGFNPRSVTVCRTVRHLEIWLPISAGAGKEGGAGREGGRKWVRRGSELSLECGVEG